MDYSPRDHKESYITKSLKSLYCLAYSTLSILTKLYTEMQVVINFHPFALIYEFGFHLQLFVFICW